MFRFSKRATCQLPKRRRLQLQNLESRRLLVSEGETYPLTQNIDAIDIVGNLSASINWGDGSTSAGTVESGAPLNKISAKFEYVASTASFFTTARRQLLETAADMVLGRLSDTLKAIQPSGSNTWTASFFDPLTGRESSRSNPTIGADELLIIVGARAMPGPQLAEGAYGSYLGANGSASFLSDVATRGQGTVTGANATDFGPWGGSLAFDNTADWYSGIGTPSPTSGQADFLTTAVHELYHLLGFGIAPSWQRLVSGGRFTGPKAVAAYDGSGNVPLNTDLQHWQTDLQDAGRESIMDPEQLSGTRKTPTPLDLAALDDIGWTVQSTTARVTANHVFADNGSYPISVTLNGSQFGKQVAEKNVAIANVSPTLVVTTDKTVAAGAQLNVTNIANISDPGFRNTAVSPSTVESFTYSINWGDNSPDVTGDATIDQIGNSTRPTLASFDASHTFTAAGNFTVRVTVKDDDNGQSVQTFRVNVTAPAKLSLASTPLRISEKGSETATLTITRSGGDLTQALLVNLSSSDTSEATVTGTATFAPNSTKTTATITSVDDNLLDGDQPVRITATSSGIEAVSIDMVIADAESLTAQFVTAEIHENDPVNSVRLRLTRSNTDIDQPLLVIVSGGSALELELINSITLPANAKSFDVLLDPVDDKIPEPTHIVNLQFSALGYSGAAASLKVLDDEPPAFQNQANNYDVDNNGNVRPIDALQIINFLNRQGGPRELVFGSDSSPPYFDVSGDYLVSPIDSLRIINAINRGGQSPEGELTSRAASPIDPVASDWVMQNWSESERRRKNNWLAP